jgi:PAS domain S-box-containing protein
VTHASIVALPPELGATPREELAYRLRQQAIVSEFGFFALRCYDLDALFQRAAVLCAQGMQTELCKVLEFKPAENRFVVRAGVGWAAGVVGQATIGADLESPAGFALKTGRPVISNHLEGESRFRTPKLLAEHGVKRAINVLIAAGPTVAPYGVLEVDSSAEGRFEEADLAFMQGLASVLGVAIERQWTEARLRESEEQARLVIEGAHDYAFITLAPDGRVTGWCPGVEAVFGYTEQEFLGLPFAELFTPEDRAAGVPERELETARALGVADDERWHLRKNGERIFVQGSTRPLHDGAGRPRGYLKIAHDETARRAEQEALVLSEERARLAVASAEIGTWDFDPATGALRWDERCKALFGLPSDAEVTYDVFLAGLHPEDRERTESMVAAALDPEGPGEYEVEYRTIGLADGRERWIAAKGKALFKGGQPVRFVGTVLDVTGSKRREEQQQLLSREVSHRVKNSLAMVASLLSLQLRQSDDSRVRAALGDAHARISTIAELHDHLWRQRDATSVALDAFLADLCAQLSETAPGHEVLFAGEPATLAADKAIPIALLVNELVTNALKYAYPDGGNGAVRVTLARSRTGALRVEVADSGVGLPAGFDPKQATASLGMRLVATLTRQLGADTTFEDAAPGTRVIVAIPL